jgi:hypothetical protein
MGCRLKGEKRPDWFAVRLVVVVVVVEANRTGSLPIVDSRIDVDRVRGGKLRRAQREKRNVRLSLFMMMV